MINPLASIKRRRAHKNAQTLLHDFWQAYDWSYSRGQVLHSGILQSLGQVLDTAASNLPINDINNAYLIEPLVNTVARNEFSQESINLLKVAMDKGLVIDQSKLQCVIEGLYTHRPGRSISPISAKYGGMARLPEPSMTTSFSNTSGVHRFLTMLSDHGADWNWAWPNAGFVGTYAEALAATPPSSRTTQAHALGVFRDYFSPSPSPDVIEIQTNADSIRLERKDLTQDLLEPSRKNKF